MKYILLFTALLFGSHALVAQQSNEMEIKLTYPNKKARLRVDLQKGDIVIKGSNRKTILLSYELKEKGGLKMETRKDGLKKISGSNPSLEVTEEHNEVEINSSHWGSSVKVSLEVPNEIDIDASTYNDGIIVVENVKGELELENYTGPITATNISGILQANTYNGDILVDFKQVKQNTPMSFNTYNGKIDLSLPASSQLDVKAKAEQGDILTGFDLKLNAQSNTNKSRKEHEGERTVYLDNWIRGTINGGGGEFTMETFNGDIYIRKK